MNNISVLPCRHPVGRSCILSSVDGFHGVMVAFLSHILARDGILVDPNGVVVKCERMKKVTEIRSFLSFAGYLLRICWRILLNCLLLRHQIRKYARLIGDCERIFQQLKHLWISAPDLTIPFRTMGSLLTSMPLLEDLDVVLCNMEKWRICVETIEGT